MGHHTEPTVHLTHEELKFKEHTERAVHFIKIDLFRSAREEFKAALEYKPDDPHCLDQIKLMNGYIERDRKSVLILVPIVLAIIVAVALLV